jgi:tRNA-dihydrouridine synthase C
VPELETKGLTSTGLPVQVQFLGGDPERMAESAQNACEAGAQAIDINFGCPAKVVNRHDGGASLLRHPQRIRQIVAAVRAAVPAHLPVSVKLRLGWDSIEPIDENAAMAIEGGASWITIHGRTRMQGYQKPIYWGPIGRVRAQSQVPVVANGDIWTLDDFKQCQEETGCIHFMIGRGALARPSLSHQIARELGLTAKAVPTEPAWESLFRDLMVCSQELGADSSRGLLLRLKQWLRIATTCGDFLHFDAVKREETLDGFFQGLHQATA